MSTKSSSSKDKKRRGDSSNNKTRESKSTRSQKGTTNDDTNTPLMNLFNNIIQNEQAKIMKKNKKNSTATSSDNSDDSDDSSSHKRTKRFKKSREDSKSVPTQKGVELNNANSNNGSTDDEGSKNSKKQSDDDSQENEASDHEDCGMTENVDSDSSSTIELNTKKKKHIAQKSIFTPHLKNQLQWYIRNPIFQKIKVIDEGHLDSSGAIIQDCLEKIGINSTSRNLNAYVNECRQIIKRTMSSRRGYVKKRIGLIFKGELYI
jgi:hypothetical protein